MLRFTLEPTDREGESALDMASIEAEAIGLAAHWPGFSARAFFQLLRSELARANRYSFLVSFVLLRIVPTPESNCETERGPLSELAHLLNQTLRTTDILGFLGNGLVGIIAPHSDLDTAGRLLRRLQAQSLFSAFRRRTGCDLRAVFAIYPTDATTISSLFEIALARLGLAAQPSTLSSA